MPAERPRDVRRAESQPPQQTEGISFVHGDLEYMGAFVLFEEIRRLPDS
jgi:hypothetical protein